MHASHFVAEGFGPSPKVLLTRFLNELSELDHTVVLFDEIDELVRERDMEKDAFGPISHNQHAAQSGASSGKTVRLFISSLTNHINYFDSAIIRSHRFDALILVSPPSFEAKIDELKRLLSENNGLSKRRFETEPEEVQQCLKQLRAEHAKVATNEAKEKQLREQKLNPEFMLAKFALLRWDELHELAFRLSAILKAQSPAPKRIFSQLLGKALRAVGDSEWRKNKSYFDFLRDMRSERRDYEMIMIPGHIKTNASKPIPKN